MDQTHMHGREPRFAIFGKAIALTFATLLLSIGGAIGYRYVRHGSKLHAPQMRIVPFTSLRGHMLNNARLSPDGNQMAYAWDVDEEYNWDIYRANIRAGKASAAHHRSRHGRITNMVTRRTLHCLSTQG